VERLDEIGDSEKAMMKKKFKGPIDRMEKTAVRFQRLLAKALKPFIKK